MKMLEWITRLLRRPAPLVLDDPGKVVVLARREQAARERVREAVATATARRREAERHRTRGRGEGGSED